MARILMTSLSISSELQVLLCKNPYIYHNIKVQGHVEFQPRASKWLTKRFWGQKGSLVYDPKFHDLIVNIF